MICSEPITGRRKYYCSTDCYNIARRKRNTQAVIKWRRRTKRRSIEYLGNECTECGYSRCDAALEFHHTDPSQKDFSISNAGNTRSWQRVREELDKCILLCANCHRELHAEIITYKTNG